MLLQKFIVLGGDIGRRRDEFEVVVDDFGYWRWKLRRRRIYWVVLGNDGIRCRIYLQVRRKRMACSWSVGCSGSTAAVARRHFKASKSLSVDV
jgi:hypothetical protein